MPKEKNEIISSYISKKDQKNIDSHDNEIVDDITEELENNENQIFNINEDEFDKVLKRENKNSDFVDNKNPNKMNNSMNNNLNGSEKYINNEFIDEGINIEDSLDNLNSKFSAEEVNKMHLKFKNLNNRDNLDKMDIDD